MAEDREHQSLNYDPKHQIRAEIEIVMGETKPQEQPEEKEEDGDVR